MITGLVVGLTLPIGAQEPTPEQKRLADLETLVKQLSGQIAQLAAQPKPAPVPEDRRALYRRVKDSPDVKDCKAEGGKALVAKGQFIGCLF